MNMTVRDKETKRKKKKLKEPKPELTKKGKSKGIEK